MRPRASASTAWIAPQHAADCPHTARIIALSNAPCQTSALDGPRRHTSPDSAFVAASRPLRSRVRSARHVGGLSHRPRLEPLVTWGWHSCVPEMAERFVKAGSAARVRTRFSRTGRADPRRKPSSAQRRNRQQRRHARQTSRGDSAAGRRRSPNLLLRRAHIDPSSGAPARRQEAGVRRTQERKEPPHNPASRDDRGGPQAPPHTAEA